MELTTIKQSYSKTIGLFTSVYKWKDFEIKVTKWEKDPPDKTIQVTYDDRFTMDFLPSGDGACTVDGFCKSDADFDKLIGRVEDAKELFLYIQNHFDTL